MASAPQRARPQESLAATASVPFGCAAADVTLPCGFAALPPTVVLRIFALMPADARARATAVCSSWNWQLTGKPTAWELWTELDLSQTSGITCARSNAALEGAAALARGHLRSLKLHDFDADYYWPNEFSIDSLMCVIKSNAHLEELESTFGDDEQREYLGIWDLDGWMLAALQRLSADVENIVANMSRALLRREPPFAALRLHELYVHDKTTASPLRTEAGVIAFAEDVAACESLRGLTLFRANLKAPAALEALVDAVLTRGLSRLYLIKCKFTSAVALPQLARLLADGRSALEYLYILKSPTLLANAREADIAALFDALAQSTKLTTLFLGDVGLPAGARAYMAVLLHKALASRPAGSVAATVTVE